RPSCCTDTWDASCVDLAGSLCGAARCTCGPDEIMGPTGHCYYLGVQSADWRAARDACLARGAGWDLAKIDGPTENSFLSSLVPSHAGAWMGLNDRPPAQEGTYFWADGTPTTYTAWGTGEPNNFDDEDCVEIHMFDGGWNDSNCLFERDYVCERTVPNASREWTQRCVNRVPSACNATCGSTSSGQCSPWNPGQTQVACAAQPDLALGTPCAGGQVPVCNHGTAPAPAGVTVAFFAPSTAQYPGCAPNLALARGSCTTSTAIAPGQCVNLTCAGLSDGDELMVNPAGGTQVPECACGDNWSIYSAAASCSTPVCARSSSESFAKQPRVLIVLDKSASMTVNGRWAAATAALRTAVSDAGMAAAQVALELFPLPAGAGASGCGQDSCDAAACQNPLVPLRALSASAAPADTHEAALLAALDTAVPEGAASSAPALRGALAWAIAQNTPTTPAVIVFVSQGTPSSCLEGDSGATSSALAREVERAYLDHGIRTYAVALEGANTSVLHELAMRGGTREAFVLDGTNSGSFAANLQSAVTDMASRSLSCTLSLTGTSGASVSAARVTLTSGASVSELDRRSRAQQCGEGWYFDDNTNPSAIVLCPQTCAAAQALPSAKLELSLGCPTNLQPNAYRQLYDGVCPAGGKTQWSFLAYDTTTPLDSSVRFRARTADTQAALAAATFVDLAVARGSPDTQRCAMSGPLPCPIDLFAKLGADDAKLRYFELEAAVIPATDQRTTSTLNTWQITYSCPPAE
ncbi:MAG TPA: lectin-like protein, partial [Polyangiaceae bacterium]|nr:lectin-like protein [Polyangiaceae bacterium]